MTRISLLIAVGGTLAVSAQSPYITKVWEYRPAPGQFINTMPEYASGDDATVMAHKAFQAIGGQSNNVISLGAWGGYVVFSFDHPVANQPGEYDFTIEGNAFFSADYPDGGSCEPGIVMVSRDVNGNGLPDDQWYQLAGSEYYNPETIHNYALTYYKPDITHTPTLSDDPFTTDSTYIRWSDNLGNEGYIQQNLFHDQSYWPEWIEGDVLTFEGTRLPDNNVNMGQDGEQNWVLYPYEYGYVDNLPNSDKTGISFNLEWAVDSDGNPVALDGADFFKVYTAVNQTSGWLGETSTEVGRATDLHPVLKPTIIDHTPIVTVEIRYDGNYLSTSNGTALSVYTLDGRRLAFAADGRISIILPSGIYIISTDSGARKIVVR